MFKAILVSNQDGHYQADLVNLEQDRLPEGDVLVEVKYSGLNYKDALAVTGKGKIIRQFPLIPGVDFSGRVLDPGASDYAIGDQVVLTGWDVGVSHSGGFSQRARVPSEWLVPLPDGLTLKQAMALGTAGFTAMLSILELEEAGVTPDSGTVVVTGASGGVGSIAIALLSSLGYQVAAVTGRASNHDYLTRLGAQQILDRAEMEAPCRPLEKQRWAGAIDTVGGPILSRLLAETQEPGAVACCGLAASHELSSTVMPFILRGIRLIGIESVRQPKARRLQIWNRLAAALPLQLLDSLIEVIDLESVADSSEKLIDGQVTGRIVIDLDR
ncbi:oxidoreductase [Motiliproteus sp.]|uniref:acrylyl-CoA reductase (NADPH) n=1 Tax=Motiliproteus sp. TaxID=1898955 RepID=UPI003BA9A53A